MSVYFNNTTSSESNRRTDNMCDYDDDVEYIETRPINYVGANPIESIPIEK